MQALLEKLPVNSNIVNTIYTCILLLYFFFHIFVSNKFVFCQANHGGVRGKLPKEAEDEEVMERPTDLDDSHDEIMATPNDEVKKL